MAKPERAPLSETQWEIMQAVWQLGEGSVSDVWKQMCESREVARNTVLTQMDRLYKKRWLKRREDGNRHLYSATSKKEVTRREHVKRWVETAFAGAADQLVLSLLESQKLTAEERQRIREMIDSAKGGKK